MDEVFRIAAIARGCRAHLTSEDVMVVLVTEAATSSGLSVVGRTVHTYVPHGLSVALLLAQSHLVVSTWPEHATVTVDIAVCTGRPAARAAWQVIRDGIRPTEVEVHEAKMRLTPSASLRTPTSR